MDLIKIDGVYPADQINADPGTTGFQQFLAGQVLCLLGGDIGSNARTNDSSVIGDVVGFSMIPGQIKSITLKRCMGKYLQRSSKQCLSGVVFMY